VTTFRERMRTMKRRAQPPQCVYFIQAGEIDGPIKIGVARDPWSRMRDLQIGSPESLNLLGHSPPCEALSIEQQLHKKLSTSSIRGEWFAPSPELFRVIERLCGDEYYLNGDARSMIGLLWPYGEDITPEMVKREVVSILPFMGARA
jgi:hypothetical protein